LVGQRYSGNRSTQHPHNPVHSHGYNRNDSYAPPQAGFGKVHGSQEDAVEEIAGEEPESALERGEGR
jgi:hypothetical protein